MKHFYFYSILLLSFTISNAQEELQGEWYLESLNLDDINYTNTINNNFHINFSLDPFEEDTFQLNGISSCNEYFGGYYITSSSSFNITYYSQTLEICGTSAEVDYEVLYWSFLNAQGAPENQPFTYEIIDENQLILTNDLGDKAYYNKQPVNDAILGEWFLHSIETGDFLYLIPNIYNNDFNINFTQESGTNGPNFSGFATCNAYSGEYTIDNTFINTFDFAYTLQDCNFNDNNFEGTYFSIFENDGVSPNFQYDVTGDTEQGSLIMWSPNGDRLKYDRQPLPVPDISGTWYLHSIFDTDLLFENEFNPNAFITFTTDDNGTTVFSGIAMCNQFSGSYLTSITPSISISDFSSTDLDCNDDDATYFESLYLPMFYNNNNNNNSDDSLIYITVTNDDENPQLNLYSINNGVWAYFGSEPLSNPEFNKTEVTLTQNPITTSLEINGLTQTDLPYSIYTIDGKIVLNGVLNTNRIDVQVLTSGLYFLKVGEKHTIKFIKM